DGNAPEEIDHVGVGQPEAARGAVEAHALRVVRAMDAVERVAAAVMEVERPRAQRVVGAGRHEFGKPALAAAHFGGRPPFRPLLLGADAHGAGPAEALAPDADLI